MTWFTGMSNWQAVETLKTLTFSHESKTLLLYGPTGVGKTWLLRNFYQQNQRHTEILWTSAETFARSYSMAVQKGSLTAFREQHRKVEIFIIDDLDRLAGKKATIDELCHTYEQVVQSGNLFIAAIKVKTLDLSYLGKRLASRMLGGTTIPIHAPEKRELLQFAQLIAADKKLVMEQETLPLITENCCNFREVDESMQGFILFAEKYQEALTVQCFRAYLSEKKAQAQILPTPENILRVTCEVTGLSAEDIRGRKKSGNILEARKLAVYAIRELGTPTSYPELGKFLKKEHGSIIRLYRQAEVCLHNDCKFQESMQKINRIFKEEKR